MFDDLDQVSTRFSALLKKETEAKKNKPSHEIVLDEHKDAIREARDLGVSYSKIAALLTESGVSTTPLQVKKFCVTVFTEIPVKRKKRRKKYEKATASLPVIRSKTAPASTLKTSRANPSPKPSKAGFRVAQDEDL